MIWSFSTDRFGRRMIINICQTLVCVILFLVGGLYWTGATTGNAAGGTALVRFSIQRFIFLGLANIVFSSSFAASGPSWFRSSVCHTTSSRPNFPVPFSEVGSLSTSEVPSSANPFSFSLLTSNSEHRARHFLYQLGRGCCFLVRPRDFNPRLEIPS